MADEKSKHGTFCWNELMTRDAKAATKFYTELVGWKAVESGMPGVDYTLLKAGDTEAGGLMQMPADVPNEVPSHWMTYIQVDDVDALVSKVTELGGQVIHGPQDIPNVGRIVIIQDPTGAAVSLFKPAAK